MGDDASGAPARDSAGRVIGRLWNSFVSPHRGDLLALAPVLVVVALSATAYGFIMKETIDALGRGDLSMVALAPLAVLVATSVRAAAIWGQALLSQGLGLKVLRDLQRAMFKKLTHADFARVSGEETGRHVSRFTNDINVIAEGLVRATQAVLRDGLTVIGALASMLYFDWVIAILVIGIFMLAGGPLASIAKRARRQTEAAQIQLGALTAHLTESLSASRFVRLFGLEAREIARADAAFEERRRIAFGLTRNRARTDPLLEVIGGAALAVVLWVSGTRIVNDAMSLGDLLGIVTAVAAAAPAARSLGSFNTVLNEALAAAGRVFAMLDEPETVVDRPGATPLAIGGGEIVFDDVGFSYGGAPALSHLSFRVAPGETVALVGPSGAGKTTILGLVPRLFDVTEGAVRIDGQDVRDVTRDSLRSAIAVVSQEAALFNDTVRANILLGRPDADEAAVVAAAKAAAAHDFIAALPQGYDTLVGERGGLLSGGERQRIALARAFLRDAPILLLDEATSALDAQSEAAVTDALARLSRGRTVVVIAHRLATVRSADRILVLDRGTLVEAGRHADLAAADGLYARLAALQFSS